jgi:hypothetical protein
MRRSRVRLPEAAPTTGPAIIALQPSHEPPRDQQWAPWATDGQQQRGVRVRMMLDRSCSVPGRQFVDAVPVGGRHLFR